MANVTSADQSSSARPRTDRPRTARPRTPVGLPFWGVTAAGVVGAATLPIVRVGVGWLVTGLAVATAVITGVITARRTRQVERGAVEPTGRGDRLFRSAVGAAAIALLGVAAVRAAGWLVAICLVTAAALASYALVGGVGWTAVGRAFLALPVAAATTMATLARSVASPGRTRPTPAHDAPATLPRVIAGAVVGVALLVVFGALFATADPEFGRRLREWTSGLTVGEAVRGGVALIVVCAVVGGAVRLVTTARAGSPEPTPAAAGSPAPAPASAPAGALREPRRGDWLEWSVPLVMLDLLFGSFVYVQLTVFFAGDEYVLGPGGPTYAQHALHGFTTLVVVCLLTLGVFAGLARWAGRGTAGRRALLRVLGGTLGVLTLVVVASALRRMAVYVDAYGFTRTRLLADAFEVWIGLGFVLILVAGIRLRAAWLPRAVLASGVAVLLGLAAINPDAYIARTVIDRYHKDQHLDAAYLATLSADAVPQINTLPDVDRSCILAYHTPSLYRTDPWYAWNAGRAAARADLRRRPRLVLPSDSYREPWQLPPLSSAGSALEVCWG